jgi:DTW domain-containing protein
LDLCICDQVPSLNSDVSLLLLTHSGEWRKPNNTGQLVNASLVSARVERWQRRQPLPLSLSKIPVLLFPEMSPENSEFPKSSTHWLDSDCWRDVEWVLIDSTWQQAHKMVRQSPELQQLPRVSLPDVPSSEYQLRKNQRQGALSTVETVIHLLKCLKLSGDSRQLQGFFDLFQQRFEAHRSNHQRHLPHD